MICFARDKFVILEKWQFEKKKPATLHNSFYSSGFVRHGEQENQLSIFIKVDVHHVVNGVGPRSD